MATIKDALGEEHYGQFRDILAKMFPGSGVPDNNTVDGFVRAFYKEHGNESGKHGLPPLPPELGVTKDGETTVLGETSRYPIYIAQAVHHRVRSMTNEHLGGKSDAPFVSEFIGHLPMVRVPVPERIPTGENPVLRTAIGDVCFRSDHLVGSVELISRSFASELGYIPARADLFTPARTGFDYRRFGAVALYLGYRKSTDTEPSFYIFEAGMATGEAKTLYLGKTMDTVIVHRSGYVPTAYSSAQNSYKGWVVHEGNEIKYLHIQPTPPRESYYAQISVAYQRVEGASNDPFGLLLEAAKRIALIGQNMGVPSGVPLQGAMADLARSLPWIHQPAYGGTGTIPR